MKKQTDISPDKIEIVEYFGNDYSDFYIRSIDGTPINGTKTIKPVSDEEAERLAKSGVRRTLNPTRLLGE